MKTQNVKVGDKVSPPSVKIDQNIIDLYPFSQGDDATLKKTRHFNARFYQCCVSKHFIGIKNNTHDMDTQVVMLRS